MATLASYYPIPCIGVRQSSQGVWRGQWYCNRTVVHRAHFIIVFPLQSRKGLVPVTNVDVFRYVLYVARPMVIPHFCADWVSRPPPSLASLASLAHCIFPPPPAPLLPLPSCRVPSVCLHPKTQTYSGRTTRSTLTSRPRTRRSNGSGTCCARSAGRTWRCSCSTSPGHLR